MGPATETTTVTDMLLKATEGEGLESSYNMFLEVENYPCIEMETVWRRHGGFALTPFVKRNFWLCTEREYVLTLVQGILRPGVGRPAGM